MGLTWSLPSSSRGTVTTSPRPCTSDRSYFPSPRRSLPVKCRLPHTVKKTCLELQPGERSSVTPLVTTHHGYNLSRCIYPGLICDAYPGVAHDDSVKREIETPSVSYRHGLELEALESLFKSYQMVTVGPVQTSLHINNGLMPMYCG